MPSYDYACETCETRFSKIRRISERHDPLPCPTCTEPANKLTTGCAINTRGAGTGDRSHSPKGALPTVGRDGKLYSADGKTVLRG